LNECKKIRARELYSSTIDYYVYVLHIYGKVTYSQWSFERKTCVFWLNLRCEKNEQNFENEQNKVALNICFLSMLIRKGIIFGTTIKNSQDGLVHSNSNC